MSYKVYEVTQTELKYSGYEVKINGKKADLNVARVSAYPFNRRWPGHQRSIDQTELINFLWLEADEKLNFEITAPESFQNVVIKPASLNITPEITDDGKILFTLEKPAYFTVEPFNRRNALHIFADNVKKYNIDKNADNVIYFDAGEHDAGLIELKSNQTLFIDEGAVVYANICAIDAENIKIIGKGILDNSRNKEVILYDANIEDNDSAVNNAKRRHTIQLEYCTNIEIEGITIRDSLVYNIRPVGCNNLNIKNVKIIGNWRYNSDGIDMHNCTDVVIDNCFVRTFDDCICVKGFDCYYEGDVEKAVYEAIHHNGKCYDVFKNVLIKNCVLWNDWGKCLEIGAETRAEEISDITFENCDVIHVSGPALDCMNIDYADVYNVTYKNINVEYDDTIPTCEIQKNDSHTYENTNPDNAPDMIRVEVGYHKEYSAGGTRRGKCRDITFENINYTGRHKPTLSFDGYSNEHKTENITIKNLTINGKKATKDDVNLVTGDFCENIKIV